MPTVSFDNIRACLDLAAGDAGTYVGRNLDLDYHRVFGGQILAQTVRCATAAADGKQVKSFTQLFPREGNSESPLTYSVTKHQEGRTFGSTGIVVTQEKVVSVATVSLHTPDAGDARQDPIPTVEAPEDLPATDMGLIPWDTRIVGGVDLTDRAVGPPTFQFWMRTPQLPDDESVHQALLAYATDLTIIGTALRPAEGLSQGDTMTKFHSAVTSHSVWFHQPLRVDDWLLVDQRSPVTAGSRVYGRGDVWTRDGRLVASFAQESMVRMLPEQ